MNCLDKSACQDGNPFGVLCSGPFPEPRAGEQSQEEQAFLQEVPAFLLHGAAFAGWNYPAAVTRPGCGTLGKQGLQGGRRLLAQSAGDGDVT